MENEISWPLMSNNISRSDLDAVIAYLKKEDPKLTHGPLVQQFEENWSRWLGVKHSLMVNSGASANDLTLLALSEIHGGGEVIVPALTWVSDISSVLKAGFKPVFVDINPRSLAMDTDKILGAITPKTRAVFLTHVLGFNGLSEKLLFELNERKIPLIEDVCESHGATHGSQKLGSFGYASNFSFYYAHHMTTIEGGMICTNDDNFYDMVRILRSHGMVRESLNTDTKNRYVTDFPDLNPDFIFAFPSHNMRPNEINGLLGLQQLPRLDKNNLIRTENFKKFLLNINPNIFRTDFEIAGSSNYAFTLVLKMPNFEQRDQVESILTKNGIEFRRGLSGGGNQLRQPYLRRLEGIPAPESLPNVDHVHHFGWYIGNYPGLESQKIINLGELLNAVG